MAQWWERSALTNVARGRSRPGAICGSVFVVGSGLAPRVSLRVLRFSSLHNWTNVFLKFATRPGQRTRMETSQGWSGFLSKYCNLFVQQHKCLSGPTFHQTSRKKGWFCRKSPWNWIWTKGSHTGCCVGCPEIFQNRFIFSFDPESEHKTKIWNKSIRFGKKMESVRQLAFQSLSQCGIIVVWFWTKFAVFDKNSRVKH